MTGPVLQCEHLSLTFRGKPVLEDVNLTLEQGAFLGIIGPNGAGKTVLLKVILGLLQPSSGAVQLFGRAPVEARGLVSYVPQFAAFDFDFPMTVFDVVMMGRMAKQRCFRRPAAEDREVAQRCLEQMAMQEFARRQIGRLSGGELQRVLFARALAAQPELLLLDEPTASLDTRIGKDVYEILDELSPKMTIILVSHDLGVISAHVQTIACLNRKLHYHQSKEIPSEVLTQMYGCPVDLIAHGHAHRVFPHHGKEQQ